MLRRVPTAITLTAEDVELFKKRIEEKRRKYENPFMFTLNNFNHDDDDEVDNVFYGRPLKSAKKRMLNERLGIEESESFMNKKQRS